MDKSHDFTQRHKLQYSITRVCGSDGFKRVKSLDVAVFEMTPEEEKKIKLQRSKLESFKNHSKLQNSIICGLKI